MSKLDILIKDFNREYKDTIAFKGVARNPVARIPFSSPRANYMLYGGVPRGRMIEFAGEEGGGKTTTALDVVANAQRVFQKEWEDEVARLESINSKEAQNKLKEIKESGPKQIIYIDSENTLDVDWAMKIGVDVDDIYLLRPQEQTAEQIFDMMLEAIKTGEVGLMVLDSVATLVPQAIFDESMEKKSYCGVSQPLTMFCNKVTPLLNKYQTCLIMINQVREDIDNPYNMYKTPGGKAFKHHCSVRIIFQKGTFIDERGNELKRSAESPAGNLVLMSIAKTKVCKPDRRTGFYTLNYNTGIDVVSDVVETALKYNFIRQSGSWYNFIDPETGEFMTDDNEQIIKLQGKPAVKEYLHDNPVILEELLQRINSQIES